MNRLIKLKHIILASCLAFLSNGCTDDGLGFSADDLRDGETTVMLDVSFSPFSEGNLTRANIDNGNGKLLSDIKDLCILVYDAETETLKEGYPQKISVNNLKEEYRTDADASNGKTAEISTKTLSGLTLNLPFGKYYIVGVANLKGGTDNTLNGNVEAIKTLKGLRAMKVMWNNTTIGNNSEMMGYFTDTETGSGVPAADKAFSTVSVNRPGMKLRAWLRRCASKITIDFDGSKLRENVTVYIQKAEIKDIPFDCTLGFGQPSGSDESEPAYNHKAGTKEETANGLYGTTPQVISYLKRGEASTAAEGDTEAGFVKPDVSNWAKITKGMSVIKDNIDDNGYETANVINFHSENADAMYFYENMQDNPDNKTKIPHADLINGGVANNTVEKDGIPNGTYIEVTAYYESNASGNYSHGTVKYRFMLGKNVTDNFEAERNYHYKLTLCPRGNGNDADWHIEFNEPEGFHVPNPWYVSYLYNHDAMLPFKYNAPKGWSVKNMTAEIITNPWYPSYFTDDEMMDPTKTIEPITPSGDEGLPYESTINRDNGNGFLSLRVPKDDNIITLKDCGETSFNYTDDNFASLNNKYYKGVTGDSKIDKSQRVIIENGQVKNDSGNEREKIEYSKDGDSYNINIPLFTRAKVMVKQSGYTGNNPFVGYQRIARVRLTVTLGKDGENDITDQADVNVVQVRRVVNPKGVYRSKDNFAPFHVKMMFLSGDNADATFSPIRSRGPWTAEIIGDDNFITLDGKQKVSGSGDTNIDFTIRFNRMASEGNKNAVVRIKYHNYTCTHLIFVRQGYDPQQLYETGYQWPLNGENLTSATGTTWSTFNMIARDKEAEDPRDEGSMFRFGNSESPIDAVNNAYKIGEKEVYHNLTLNEFNICNQSANGVFQGINEKGELLDTEIRWSDIKPDQSGFTVGGTAKAATIRDFEQLYLTPNIRFGYGVLYADGATETQTTLDMAYGYYRRDNSSNAKAKGMRGMFAYYWDGSLKGGNKFNARNVFFPIGRSGYGHRKNSNEDTNNGTGILRYSIRCKPSSQYSGAPASFYKTAPLFESIYRRPGGIYWARKTVGENQFVQWDGTKGTEGVPYGLDINYFSFDVNAITSTNVNAGGDACFVRTVVGDNE